MARREKHRRAERLARAGVVFDEPYEPAPAPAREPRNGYGPGELEEMILGGLQHLPHMYQGTVDPVTVAERRAANKRARKARRRNRLANAHAVAWLVAAEALIVGAAYLSAVPA